MSNKIIVGIDPGTTLGYAILDLYGNLIKVASSKNFPINSLVNEVIRYGKVTVVGTDVRPTPKFVIEFAAKNGSKIIPPDESLKVVEKRRLVSQLNTTVKNRHELDALASALFAYKKINLLFIKIDKALEKENRLNYSEEAKELALKTNMSISSIIEYLDAKNKPPIESIKVKKEKPSIKELKTSEKDRADEVGYLKRKVRFLRKKNNKLVRLLRKNVDEKIDALLKFKDARIIFLNNELKGSLEKIELLNEKIIKLEDYLLNNENLLFVPKVDSIKEVLAREFKSRIIFIQDVNVYSDIVINELSDKFDIIITSKTVNQKIKSRLKNIVIEDSNLSMIKEDNFAVIEKLSLNKELSQLNLLSKVISEYKKERA